VSTRTFFNYFPSKEAALFGMDPERATALRERVAHEAPGEPVLDALRTVMVSDAQALADGLPEHCDVRHVTGNVADRKDTH
jgi:AcrR family transcriptional regulator